MSDTQTTPRDYHFYGVSPFFLVDIFCPFVVYQFAPRIFPGLPQIAVLAMSALFPVLSCAFCLARKQHPDVLGLTIIGAIIVGMLAILVGIDAPLIFPIITGTLGIIYLVSLAFPKPLAFYIGRQIVTKNDPVMIDEFSLLGRIPRAQTQFRFLTLLWGAGLTIELGVQFLLYIALPIKHFETIFPLLKTGVFVGLMIWTVIYLRWQRKQ